jgi:hypothetical protein
MALLKPARPHTADLRGPKRNPLVELHVYND